VCWTLAGFASGYLSRAYEQEVYCIEERCRGTGDAYSTSRVAVRCKLPAIAFCSSTITSALTVGIASMAARPRPSSTGRWRHEPLGKVSTPLRNWTESDSGLATPDWRLRTSDQRL
jgi:hypothetical protein